MLFANPAVAIARSGVETGSQGYVPLTRYSIHAIRRKGDRMCIRLNEGDLCSQSEPPSMCVGKQQTSARAIQCDNSSANQALGNGQRGGLPIRQPSRAPRVSGVIAAAESSASVIAAFQRALASVHRSLARARAAESHESRSVIASSGFILTRRFRSWFDREGDGVRGLAAARGKWT